METRIMKTMTAKQKEEASKISALCCIVCRLQELGESPAEIHHVRFGNGMGQRDHDRIIPLCPNHHRIGGYGVALHAGKKAFERKYGTEYYLLEQTNKLLEG
jgi:hypothetical protein